MVKETVFDISQKTVSLIMGFSLLSASEFLQTEKWRCAKQ